MLNSWADVLRFYGAEETARRVFTDGTELRERRDANTVKIAEDDDGVVIWQGGWRREKGREESFWFERLLAFPMTAEELVETVVAVRVDAWGA